MDDKILLDKNPVLVIDKSILDNIINMSKKSDVEIGGILIGYKLKNVNEYRITEVTFPYEDDVSYRALFERKDKKHNIQLQKKHKKDLSLTYLGDWHSHPKSSANPSNLDLETYKKHTENSKTSSKHLFYIIVGNEIDIKVHSYVTKKMIKSIRLEC